MAASGIKQGFRINSLGLKFLINSLGMKFLERNIAFFANGRCQSKFLAINDAKCMPYDFEDGKPRIWVPDDEKGEGGA